MNTTKYIFYTFFASIFTFGVQAQHENHQSQEKSTTNKEVLSPHTSAMAVIDGAHIHIDYSSPRVRDRIIFGGLVGFNTIWQAGAHKATWIETDKDLVIDNKTLPAGKYGFFVIPGKENWKVMFNSRWDQHGKDEYDESENVLSLNVAPEELDEIQEALSYEVKETGADKGTISLAWEKTKIHVPFKVAKR
ncbi:DUF2911 domain-containing protein [Antarcticibacterium flavum]|uniref:DUF2911 domain-containing protein n=1 Tax=Antarcticibacterium flavum TaxID=2058175 RepID=A0A5B7X6K1_9FLAO|nr:MULTISPECIES: DUF2911 domain-containing protein [Antarcticibacterium]MCM4158503.1 hypothetical protein [Antarcticibacterium sp. W02-3]QCY70253.1 DUF2911 domain-containing protein [Antarcticibacterium flavum]